MSRCTAPVGHGPDTLPHHTARPCRPAGQRARATRSLPPALLPRRPGPSPARAAAGDARGRRPRPPRVAVPAQPRAAALRRRRDAGPGARAALRAPPPPPAARPRRRGCGRPLITPQAPHVSCPPAPAPAPPEHHRRARRAVRHRRVRRVDGLRRRGLQPARRAGGAAAPPRGLQDAVRRARRCARTAARWGPGGGAGKLRAPGRARRALQPAARLSAAETHTPPSPRARARAAAPAAGACAAGTPSPAARWSPFSTARSSGARGCAAAAPRRGAPAPAPPPPGHPAPRAPRGRRRANQRAPPPPPRAPPPRPPRHEAAGAPPYEDDTYHFDCAVRLDLSDDHRPLPAGQTRGDVQST